MLAVNQKNGAASCVEMGALIRPRIYLLCSQHQPSLNYHLTSTESTMAARPTLPYFAPAALLPAPLPTVAEILASKRRISAYYEAPVVRIGDHYAVKYGKGTSLQEGENMLFVQQSTSIPVPKVYALFHDKATKNDFIVMDYIPGRELKAVWDELSTAEKRTISLQLRRNLDELRSIPSPGYYGGIWRQVIRDFYFTDTESIRPHPEPELSGPKETEEQWAEAMWQCLKKVVMVTGERELAMFRRHYHAIFKGHKPVFTHANLFTGNIMLKEDGTVVIIDWERAGWYPSFWEYCCTILLVRHEDDWGEWVHEILDTYVGELGWMAHHRTTLSHY